MRRPVPNADTRFVVAAVLSRSRRDDSEIASQQGKSLGRAALLRCRDDGAVDHHDRCGVAWRPVFKSGRLGVSAGLWGCRSSQANDPCACHSSGSAASRNPRTLSHSSGRANDLDRLAAEPALARCLDPVLRAPAARWPQLILAGFQHAASPLASDVRASTRHPEHDCDRDDDYDDSRCYGHRCQ
jgi:hypothetical protein